MLDVRPSILFLFALLVLAASCSVGNGDAGDATPAGGSATAGTASTPPAADPTETPILIRPRTPSPSASPTVAGTPDAYTPEQAALAAVLLRPGDLSGGWTVLRQVAVKGDPRPGLCGAPPFPEAHRKFAEVETEFQAEDNTTYVVENLVEYSEDVAARALDYIRKSVDCQRFTDSAGLAVELAEAEAPELGDDAFAVQVSFQAGDGGRLQGEFVYVRVGGLLASISYLTAGDFDRAQVLDVAERVTAKLASTGGSVRFTPAERELLDALLAPEDVDNGWVVLNAAGVSDPEGWRPLCDAEPFAGFDDLLGRVSTLVGSGSGAGAATVRQALSAYPSSVADDALAYERESASCAEWEADGTTVTLTPSALEDLPEDAVAVHFTFMQDGNQVDGEWIAVRVDNLITNLIYTAPEEFDAELAQDVLDAAIDKLQEVTLP